MKHLRHAPLSKLPNADRVHENGVFVGNHHYIMNNEFELLHDTLTDFVKTAG